MVYEARYLARNCELKKRFGDIVSHLRHLSEDKTKLLFSFFLILFNYAIQGKFITWLVNSALNCTWKPISHSSLRDSCDIGFRVQFNAEFTSQVMNVPIVSSTVKSDSCSSESRLPEACTDNNKQITYAWPSRAEFQTKVKVGYKWRKCSNNVEIPVPQYFWCSFE